MTVKTIEELFIHELSDIYSAEKQLTKALPKNARAASSPDLVAAFESHLEETVGQVDRIDKIVELLGIKLKRMKCAAMEADEKSVVVTVTDSGIGISPDAIPHIFEPLVQERSAIAFNGMGLGIGLTVVRDMCQAHGGQVEAYSEGINKGASFVVTLARVFDAGPRR